MINCNCKQNSSFPLLSLYSFIFYLFAIYKMLFMIPHIVHFIWSTWPLLAVYLFDAEIQW
jgi:hypothetical protein